MSIFGVVLLLSLSSGWETSAGVRSAQARCETAYTAKDDRRIIDRCGAAAKSYANLAASDAGHFWQFFSLFMEGIDLLNVSVSEISTGETARAHANALKARVVLEEVRHRCPIFRMRDMAGDVLRHVDKVLNLFGDSPEGVAMLGRRRW